MLKSIPKSNISVRDFKVYKNWTIENSEIPVISASLESGLFDTGSSNQQESLYTSPLYSSVKAKYYRQEGNIVTTYGAFENLAMLERERNLSSTAYIIDIPQIQYGEGIKKGSVRLTNNASDVTYRDNQYGQIAANVPLYTLRTLDFDTEEIVIEDVDGERFEGTITNYDSASGDATLTFGSDTDLVNIVRIDLVGEEIQFREPLDFDGLDINEQTYGNIFYSDGLFVLNTALTNYTLRYKSTQTIFETEILVTSNAGEFNYSQNPSAIEVTVSGSYNFEETAIPGIQRARTRKIKHYSDIKRKESFVGSYSSSISGSWDDYSNKQLSDPTGSFITTYITTIGLYDNDGDMVAIAKLPTPIKNLPDYDLNFIVRFDT